MAPPSRQVFGQTMKKGSAGSNYRRQIGGKTNFNSSSQVSSDKNQNDTFNRAEYRRIKEAKGQIVDRKFGIERFTHDSNNSNTNTKRNQGSNSDTNDDTSSNMIRQKRGWLYNVLPTTVSD
jgi:hypothetical protein